MMKNIFTPILAGALLITTALPFAVQAGKGSGGTMSGSSLQIGPSNLNFLKAEMQSTSDFPSIIRKHF
jgi:hypothetical protein